MISQAKWNKLVEHYNHDYAAMAGALRVMCFDSDADFLLTVPTFTQEKVP